MFRASRYATNRSENVCSRCSASIMAFLSMRSSSQSVIALADPIRKCCPASTPSPKKSPWLNIPRVASLHLRHHREPNLTFLDIKHFIGYVSLRKDRLLLRKRHHFPALADRGKKFLRVELAIGLGRHD